MTAIDGVFCVGRACYKQTRSAFQSSRVTGVRLCTRCCTAGVDKRVRSTSLYHGRQCSIVRKPRSDRTDYTVFALWRSTAADSCGNNRLPVRAECGL